MIWTFTPNPALDITWQAPDQTRGQVHRITEYSQRPGGKGLNVSRVLEQLGVPNHATGFLGGTTGQAIASLMEEMTTQVTTHWVDVPVQTRRSIAMIDGEATVYNESGFSLPPHSWEEMRELLKASLSASDVLVVSGSLPGDTSFESLEPILESARERGCRIILDTSGPSLVECARWADVLKPNHHELLDATGASSIEEGALTLLELGPTWVCVSRGEEGVELFSPPSHWHAEAGVVLEGNPTGAGDACVASLARSLAQAGDDLESIISTAIAEAVATSAAAVTMPVAGEIDCPLREELLARITPIRLS